MPAPDGRAWLTSEDLANRFLDALVAYDPRAETLMDKRPELVEAVKTIFADLYGTEFKIARLCEQLKDAIRTGEYGALYDGEGSLTDLGSVRDTFEDIYDWQVLQCYDEEGNYICE